MNGEDEAKALAAEERSRGEPGLGAAMLAVVAMLFITAVLSLLIYGLMAAIRPIETRQPKPAEVGQTQPSPIESAPAPAASR